MSKAQNSTVDKLIEDLYEIISQSLGSDFKGLYLSGSLAGGLDQQKVALAFLV